MNDTILIKSGTYKNRPKMPNLNENELGFQKDEKALCIGTKDGNLVLCTAGDRTTLINHEAQIRALEAEMDTIIARLEALEKANE